MDVVIDPIQDLEPVGGRGLADKAARPDERASAAPGREGISPGQGVGDKTTSAAADKAAGEGQAPMSAGRARNGRAHALGEAKELPDSEKQKRSLAIETARKRCVPCLPWSAVGGAGVGRRACVRLTWHLHYFCFFLPLRWGSSCWDHASAVARKRKRVSSCPLSRSLVGSPLDLETLEGAWRLLPRAL